jgi:hypothetical protein
MKKTQVLLLLVSLIIALTFFSCTDDDDIFSLTEDRDAFLGTWNVTESCTKEAYSVTIIKDPSNSSQVIIENFWLIGFNEKPPYAIVAGTTITIPEQAICYNASNIVSGSGKLDKGKIEWDYTVNDGADLWSCTATYEQP